MVQVTPSTSVGVLVVTVWTEEGGLRRLVSRTGPESPPGSPTSLRRRPAATDAEVLAMVEDWLGSFVSDAPKAREVTALPPPAEQEPDRE